jgi:opacity protein-like surface antigen
VQIEAEGRWQRFNQYAGIYEDNYLIGPRLPVRRFGSATVYGKALIGEGKMHFDPFDYGSFTALAFGGGLDYQLTRKLSLRVLDAEYQYWPKWGDAHLAPYGASAGIGYRIF